MRDYQWFKVFGSLAEAEQRVAINQVARVHLSRLKLHIVLARTRTGFYACQEMCPHRQMSFAKGYATDFDEIVCPWHNYRFDLHSGINSSFNGCRDVQVYPVRVDEAGLHVGVPMLRSDTSPDAPITS